MAYQPPPGTFNSLPPRPPSGASNGGRSGFKPAFSPTSKPPGQPYSSGAAYNASAPRFPAGPPGSQYGASTYPSYPGAPAPSNVSSAGRGYGNQTSSSSSSSQPSYGSSNYRHAGGTYGAAPQIRNPFPNPNQVAASAPALAAAAAPNPNDYDPDMAAQIAHWQSAYSREPAAPTVDKHGKPIGPDIFPKPETPNPANVDSANPDKKKTVVRQGGGKKWTDDSLLEWDPAHLRLFVGNLAGETTDDSLLKAFAPWTSVQKAKVVRDKRTNKSKGYGFVSFSDADDFFNAAKAMNGQYIQSHPVIVKKANTEIKAVNAKDKRGAKSNSHNNNKKNQHEGKKSGAQAGAYEPSLGPVAHAGITKPGQKTKNGLRLLG